MLLQTFNLPFPIRNKKEMVSLFYYFLFLFYLISPYFNSHKTIFKRKKKRNRRTFPLDKYINLRRDKVDAPPTFVNPKLQRFSSLIKLCKVSYQLLIFLHSLHFFHWFFRFILEHCCTCDQCLYHCHFSGLTNVFSNSSLNLH